MIRLCEISNCCGQSASTSGSTTRLWNATSTGLFYIHRQKAFKWLFITQKTVLTFLRQIYILLHYTSIKKVPRTCFSAFNSLRMTVICPLLATARSKCNLAMLMVDTRLGNSWKVLQDVWYSPLEKDDIFRIMAWKHPWNVRKKGWVDSSWNMTCLAWNHPHLQ